MYQDISGVQCSVILIVLPVPEEHTVTSLRLLSVHHVHTGKPPVSQEAVAIIAMSVMYY